MEAQESAEEVAEEIAQNEQNVKQVYAFPPIDLLKLPTNGVADGTAEMRENSESVYKELMSK